MSGGEIGILSVMTLLVVIYFGMHIGTGLTLTSLVGVWMLNSPEIVARIVAAAANDTLRDYLLGVIPLLVVMGLLVSVSGVGRDTFDVAQWSLRRIKGGLGVATVASNAIFAAITGISIVSASVFPKVAMPEMIRHPYPPKFAVGVAAGSSVLGMLIPPSLLMFIYGVKSEESIGNMFISGTLPGVLLAVAFSAMIVAMACWKVDFMFVPNHGLGPKTEHTETVTIPFGKGTPIVVLIGLVLGGLYCGLFTPTEVGAIGAFGALVIALMRRALDLSKLRRVLVETGHISVSVLFPVLSASPYNRMLALNGLPATIAERIKNLGLGAYVFLGVYPYPALESDTGIHKSTRRP